MEQTATVISCSATKVWVLRLNYTASRIAAHIFNHHSARPELVNDVNRGGKKVALVLVAELLARLRERRAAATL